MTFSMHVPLNIYIVLSG